MGNTYPGTGEKPGKLHVWGYLVGVLAGIGAGVLVAGLLDGIGAFLACMVGLLAAAVVAGAILFLVCYLSGNWEEEVSAVTRETGMPAAFGGVTAPDNDIPAQSRSEWKGGESVCRGTLKTNRGLVKFVLLNFITLGIYGIYAMWAVGNDINVIARKYDGKKTMNYCLVYFLLSGLTMGIAALVWYHRVSARIGVELQRRNIGYRFGAGSFWGWNLLGLFIAIGPFIYMYKLFKAMNLLSKDYNVNF